MMTRTKLRWLVAARGSVKDREVPCVKDEPSSVATGLPLCIWSFTQPRRGKHQQFMQHSIELLVS